MNEPDEDMLGFVAEALRVFGGGIRLKLTTADGDVKRFTFPPSAASKVMPKKAAVHARKTR